jgi:hypothetical protein
MRALFPSGSIDPDARTFRPKEGNHLLGAEHELMQPTVEEATDVVLIDAAFICSGSNIGTGSKGSGGWRCSGRMCRATYQSTLSLKTLPTA